MEDLDGALPLEEDHHLVGEPDGNLLGASRNGEADHQARQKSRRQKSHRDQAMGPAATGAVGWVYCHGESSFPSQGWKPEGWAAAAQRLNSQSDSF
ncbi:MAG: hypothetical protein CW349_02940 [Firmicutes bacterium]|nr:hypothetical protein [Bacillota bacterium]